MDRYLYKDGHKDYQIIPYPGSGHEPFKIERGKFQAEVTMTTFDNDDRYPVFQKTSDKWYWYENNGNVYSSKTSKKVLFNLLHQ